MLYYLFDASIGCTVDTTRLRPSGETTHTRSPILRHISTIFIRYTIQDLHQLINIPERPPPSLQCTNIGPFVSSLIMLPTTKRTLLRNSKTALERGK
ncbi:hypothetical protein EVAR_69851_1, partial [Eumeta japonica]